MNGKKGFWPWVLRLLMTLLAFLYCGVLAVYLMPFHIGIRKQSRLQCRVVSIGNLTTGGTGKTPFTIMLCKALQAAGKNVVVLSRGYRGKNEFGSAVVSDHDRVFLTAEEAGDEAFLLAQSLPGIPVIAGKDRRLTGTKAIELFHPDIVLLDDGFQYWQLHRDLDIVLLNAAAPFDNGWTLPRGLLRVPLSHLKRAGVVVLTNSSRCDNERITSLKSQVQELAPDRPIYLSKLVPVYLQNLEDGTAIPTNWLQDRKIAVYSALGNPEGFENTVQLLGVHILERSRFRDHTTLSSQDLTSICERAHQLGAEAVVTTSKDAVKIQRADFRLPIYALHVEMEIDNLSFLIQKVFSEIEFNYE